MGDPILFFDGACGLCHRTVRWLLRRDRRGVLRFAPLSGETFHARFDEAARRALPDSIVTLSPEGTIFVRSDAVIAALRNLGRGERIAAALLAAVPRSIRDRSYDLVARARRRLFRPPEAVCPRVPPELADRFLS